LAFNPDRVVSVDAPVERPRNGADRLGGLEKVPDTGMADWFDAMTTGDDAAIVA
jgi:hypothetical protein